MTELPLRTLRRREYAEFEDPDYVLVWKVDLTFLTSRWGCIYGNGCKGVYPKDSGRESVDGGCCTHGAYLDDKTEIRKIERAAGRLTATDWQFRDVGLSTGFLVRGEKDNGPKKTRVLKGACIFANRNGFEGGIGCAFHKYALRTGKHPSDVKPHVCWMLPLRDEVLEEDARGRPTKMLLTEYATKDWGEGQEFTWYCIDRPEAFGNAEGMVYRTQEVEIRKLVGDAVYRAVARHIDKRLGAGEAIAEHPTQRRRARRAAAAG